METVLMLERQHVDVHVELLALLQQLAMLRQGVLPSTERSEMLEVQRALQLSLEKSAALQRAIEYQSEESDAAEVVLGRRLTKLAEECYELDAVLAGLLGAESERWEELRQQQTRYQVLMEEYRELIPMTHTVPAADDRLERENETISQLLLALKMHGGYPL